MPEAGRRVPVLNVLSELAALMDPSEQERIARLAERLAMGRIRILVTGEAKRGKSTVVNALLGRKVLPTGVTLVTAVATVVRYDREEHVAVEYTDRRTERRRIDELADLVTERGNPGNRLGLAQVTVHLDAGLLTHGVEIVDAPGTGSVHEHNTTEAERALETMDAAVFVLTADPPMSAAERALLERVADTSVTTFVLLNKADRLDESERAEAVAFAARHAGAALGDDVTVRPVSARAGSADAGFASFTAAFARYLTDGRTGDLEESVIRQTRRLIDRLNDEVRLERRVLDMRDGEAADRLAAFRERLRVVTARRRDAVDLAEAESRRLLAALDDEAGRAARRLTGEVRDRVGAAIAEQRRPGEIERDGRDRLVALARSAVEGWREGRRQRLEKGLADLDARLTGVLDRELAGVRDDAAELLGLDLAVPAEEDRLIEDPRFFYVLSETAGQTELLAGAIRRRVPGEFGRRRAREHVLGEAAELVPKQIGRARADLQYRLGDAIRALVRALDRRYAESVDRLGAVVDAAAAAEANTNERARTRRLDETEALLNTLHAQLTSATHPDASCTS